jgi:hypothetical protein
MKKIYLIIFIGFLFASCKKSNTLPTNDSNNQSLNSEEKSHKEKLEFGKALATSLNNKDLRDLIKTEALKQFDNDYDVLFSNIMDRKLVNGKTVIEFIASNSVNPNELISSVSRLPLLNIFVPELENFSSNSWDTNVSTPLVAVIKESDITKGNNTITTFDKNGGSLDLSYSEKPKIPVLVIKDNERIIINKKTGGKTSFAKNVSSDNPIKDYDFIYPAFDNTQSKTISKSNSKKVNSVGALNTNVDNSQMIDDPGVRYAYEKNLNSQRDYIYYGLDASNGIDTGTFRTNYSEHIVSIQLGNEMALQKITDNWTEGNLEIVINVTMLTRTGTPITITKGISCTADDLKTVDIPRANQVPGGPTRAPLVFSGFTPIEIDTWDAYKYGDKWKFIISELDSGNETTVTVNMSSTFTNNFSNTTNIDAGDIKYGTTTGSTNGFTNSSTFTIKSTDNSDTLYEGFLNFYTPIYNRVTESDPRRSYTYPVADKIMTGYINLEVRPLQ